MSSETTIPKPIEEADAEAVERQYGKLGLVYAETRSQIAQPLGKPDDASKWHAVRTEIAGREQNEK